MMYIKLHSPFSLAVDFADIFFCCEWFLDFVANNIPRTTNRNSICLLFTSHRAPHFSQRIDPLIVLVFKFEVFLNLSISTKLINEVVASGFFPAKWVGADAAFGGDIDFLNALPKDLSYFAAIKSDTRVFTKKSKLGLAPYKSRGRRPSKVGILSGQPKPRSVAEIAKSGRLSFKPVVVAEGSKGPIIAKVARIRVYLSRDGLPTGDQQWAFFRQNTGGEIKYAISNAEQ